MVYVLCVYFWDWRSNIKWEKKEKKTTVSMHESRQLPVDIQQCFETHISTISHPNANNFFFFLVRFVRYDDTHVMMMMMIYPQSNMKFSNPQHSSFWYLREYVSWMNRGGLSICLLWFGFTSSSIHIYVCIVIILNQLMLIQSEIEREREKMWKRCALSDDDAFDVREQWELIFRINPTGPQHIYIIYIYVYSARKWCDNHNNHARDRENINLWVPLKGVAHHSRWWSLLPITQTLRILFMFIIIIIIHLCHFFSALLHIWQRDVDE